MRLVVVSFALGLTAKSMLVTMPFVLLLLDYWPLRRIAAAADGDAGNAVYHLLPPRVLLEKVPLLAFSAGSCMLTIWAQSLVAAFKPLDLQYRVGNALISYAAYIGQMFYPAGMVVQYVHPGPSLLLQDTLLPVAVLAADHAGRRLAGLAAALPGRRLVLVSGHARAGHRIGAGGAQARADRYTYLTQIGLYIMIAWGLSDLARTWRGRTVSLRRRCRADHRRAGRRRLDADFLLAEQPHLVGTQRRLPRRNERFCPELVRPWPWPTPAGWTRPWSTTSRRWRSIPSISRRGSTVR